MCKKVVHYILKSKSQHQESNGCDAQTPDVEKFSVATKTLGNRGFRSYICSFCAYCTHDRTVMSRHLRKHTGERPYVCVQHVAKDFLEMKILRCITSKLIATIPKSFLCNAAAENSMYIRKKDGIHFCVICSYASVYKNDIRRHLRKHTGERPFICETCGKSFTRKHNLQLHMMMHIS